METATLLSTEEDNSVSCRKVALCLWLFHKSKRKIQGSCAMYENNVEMLMSRNHVTVRQTEATAF